MFAVIAGLRLDTTLFDRYNGRWAPRWYPAYRPPYGFTRGIPSDCVSNPLRCPPFLNVTS